MTLFQWFFFKLFLVKEIKSRTGVLHFRRFRLFYTPWFAVYVHRISASDEEEHAHDHPWDFASLLLRGSYRESFAVSPYWNRLETRRVKAWQFVTHNHTDVHKLTLITPVVWSFVVTKGRYDWGYQTDEGWMMHEDYRKRKNALLHRSVM